MPDLNNCAYWDTKRAALSLGVTPKFLQALRQRGGGPVFAKLGRRVVYAKHELDRWVEANSYSSTVEARFAGARP